MAGSTNTLDLISPSQAQKEVTANALFDAASPAMTLGRKASTCSGLSWGYYGGAVMASGVPALAVDGVIALTASSTNYVEVNPAGAVVLNTIGWQPANSRLYKIITGASTVTSYEDWRLRGAGGSGSSGSVGTVFIVPVSVDSADLTTGTSKVTFRAPFAMSLLSIRASLTTASSSGIVTVNVKRGGTSVFSTLLTVDATEKSSSTAAVPAVLSLTSFADDVEVTIDVTVAGTGARGLKLYFYGTV